MQREQILFCWTMEIEGDSGCGGVCMPAYGLSKAACAFCNAVGGHTVREVVIFRRGGRVKRRGKHAQEQRDIKSVVSMVWKRPAEVRLNGKEEQG